MWNSDSGPISIWDVKMPSVNFFQLYNIQSTTLLPLQCLYVHFVFCAHNCIFFSRSLWDVLGKHLQQIIILVLALKTLLTSLK